MTGPCAKLGTKNMNSEVLAKSWEVAVVEPLQNAKRVQIGTHRVVNVNHCGRGDD